MTSQTNWLWLPIENSTWDYLKEILSVKSHQSNESNGFNSTNQKPERFYKEGTATFYSGRLYTHRDMALTQYSNGSNKTLNWNLWNRDTFMNLFPNYWTNKDVWLTTMKWHYVYPKVNPDGQPTHVIDRTYNNKMDRIKTYNEEMLKISNMWAGAKWENKKAN